MANRFLRKNNLNLTSMFEAIKHRVSGFINSGTDRSIKAKKNIFQMLVLKGGHALIGFLLVPLTLHYVDSNTYGIWIALSSMVAWMSFFDIGLNNGLKNTLTQAIATGDSMLCKKLTSTTYFLLTVIFLPLMAVLLFLLPIFDWQSLLNISYVENSTLLISLGIVICYFCTNFIFSTVNVVLTADQQPSYASFLAFLQQLATFLVILFLVKTTKGDLKNLCLGLCVTPLIVIILSNVLLFRRKYKAFAPSIKMIDMSCAPQLLQLGVQFFIIQIAAIIQYQTINFLILRYYGAADVTSYNISYKYFNMLYMIWGIVTTPIWVAVTDALVHNDTPWIKDTIKKYVKLFFLFASGGIIMLLSSTTVYRIWVGNAVEIPLTLSAWVLLYNLILMFGIFFVSIVNGSGKLKPQLYASLISPLVFVGCFLALHRLGWGIESIIFSAIVSNFNGLIIAPLQCKQIIKQKYAIT